MLEIAKGSHVVVMRARAHKYFHVHGTHKDCVTSHPVFSDIVMVDNLPRVLLHILIIILNANLISANNNA